MDPKFQCHDLYATLFSLSPCAEVLHRAGKCADHHQIVPGLLAEAALGGDFDAILIHESFWVEIHSDEKLHQTWMVSGRFPAGMLGLMVMLIFSSVDN